jgi:hypothetical protein
MCCRSLLSAEGLLNARGLVDLWLKNKEEKNRRDNLLSPGHVHKVLQRLIASCYIVCSINQPAFNPSADFIRYWTPLSTLLHYLFRGVRLGVSLLFVKKPLSTIVYKTRTRSSIYSRCFSLCFPYCNVSNFNHNGTYNAPYTSCVTETLYPLHLSPYRMGAFLGWGTAPPVSTGPKTIPIEAWAKLAPFN